MLKIFSSSLVLLLSSTAYAADKPVCMADIKKVPKGALLQMDKACATGLSYTLPKKVKR